MKESVLKIINLLFVLNFVIYEYTQLKRIMLTKISASYSMGNSIFIFIMFLLLVLGFVFLRKKTFGLPIYLKSLFLGLTITLLTFLHGLYNPIGNAEYLEVMLPFLSFNFYFFSIYNSKKNYTKLMNTYIYEYSFVFLVLFFIYFSFTRYISAFLQVDTVYNAVYFIIYLLPFVLLLPNKILRYICLAIALFAAIISQKRTATIGIVAAFICYYFVNNKVQNRNIGKTLLFFIAFLTLGALFYSFLSTFNDGHLIERFENLGDDGGSGRDVIWRATWLMIQRSDMLSFLLGHGWNSVKINSPFHIEAHNDFLELWYDYGLLSLLLYILFFFGLIGIGIKLIKKRSDVAPSFCASLFIFLMSSMTSHIFLYPYDFLIFMTFWGITVPVAFISDKNIFQNKKL